MTTRRKRKKRKQRKKSFPHTPFKRKKINKRKKSFLSQHKRQEQLAYCLWHRKGGCGTFGSGDPNGYRM